MFTGSTGKNSSKSTFINTQESLNGTRNFTQQDIQFTSRFINEEIVETGPTTTQQSISPIHPTLTTYKNQKNSISTNENKIYSKPSVSPKDSQMDYQVFRPATTSGQTNKQKGQIETIFQIIITIFFCKKKQNVKKP